MNSLLQLPHYQVILDVYAQGVLVILDCLICTIIFLFIRLSFNYHI